MTNKNLEQKIKSSNKYGPTTPEEVDERKEHPELYREPSVYHGPTTPEEVDERKSYPDLYRRPYRRYGHTDSCPDND